jgi:hypothetical protein
VALRASGYEGPLDKPALAYELNYSYEEAGKHAVAHAVGYDRYFDMLNGRHLQLACKLEAAADRLENELKSWE